MYLSTIFTLTFVLALATTIHGAASNQRVWAILPSPDGTKKVTEKTTYGVLDSSLVSTTQGSQLLFGGYRTIDDIVYDSTDNITLNEMSSELWQFTISQGSDDVTWNLIKAHGAPPYPMAKHRAFWIPEKKEMLVYGGFYQIDQRVLPAINDMYSYHLDKNIWEVHSNVTGLSSTYTFDNAVVYISPNILFQYGGHDHDDMDLSDDIAIFTLDNKTWSFLEYNRSLPNPGRRQHHGIAYNSKHKKVFLYGGTNWSRMNPWGNPAEYLNDFWEFSMETKKWKLLNVTSAVELPAIGEFSMHSLEKDDEIVIYGGCVHKAIGRGFESSCAQVSNKLLIYNVGTSTMSVLESFLNVTRHSSSSLFDISLFFGGLIDGGASNANLNNFMYMFGPKFMPFQNGDTDENGIYVHPHARPNKSVDWTNMTGAIGGLLTLIAFVGFVVAFFVVRRRKQKYATLRNID